MFYIAVAWLVASIVSIVPAGLSAWQIGMENKELRYIAVALIGSAAGNISAAVLVLLALPALAVTEQDIDVGTVLLTFTFMCPTLSMLMLSLHLSRLFTVLRHKQAAQREQEQENHESTTDTKPE